MTDTHASGRVALVTRATTGTGRTTTTEAPVSHAAAPGVTPPTRRIGGRPALYLLASLIVSLLAASAAPTPLYATYARSWGFTPVTTTIVFGVYAIAVLAALLTLGRLSDYLGRKPVLLAALAVQAASLAVFTMADGTGELLLARIIQGLATGSALGAIGAGMIDVDRERGTLANALLPGLGTGSGAIASALCVQYLPAPTHLVYLVIIAILAVQAAGVALLRETVRPARPGLSVLVPELRLPASVRGRMLAATPVVFAVWALAGLYGALGPSLVQAMTGSASEVLGGLSLTALAAPAVVSVYLLRGLTARRVMLVGTTVLVAGVAITLAALSAGSVVLFFAGTVVSGIGFGSGFQGGIHIVVPQASPRDRAGVLSLLFTVAYLGMGVPAVGAGLLAVHGLGLIGAARCYGAALVVLAALALAGLHQARPAARHAETPRLNEENV
jgi:MFS family permease